MSFHEQIYFNSSPRTQRCKALGKTKISLSDGNGLRPEKTYQAKKNLESWAD